MFQSVTAAVPGTAMVLAFPATVVTSSMEDHAKSETHSVNHQILMEPVLNVTLDTFLTTVTALLFPNWPISLFTIQSAALRSLPLSTNQKALDF